MIDFLPTVPIAVGVTVAVISAYFLGKTVGAENEKKERG